MPITAQFKIEGISPMSQSRFIQSAKKPKETHADFESRTWRERLHVDSTGHVFIPQMSVKNCLSEAAKFLSRQIPGKGKATYTKHFEAGILCLEQIPLHDAKGKLISGDSIDGEWLFVPSDGKRGGGSRVEKCFPFIPAGWQASGELMIVDETITKEVLIEHFREAGNLIGIGRFRPRNNGFYGRFKLKALSWEEHSYEDEVLEAAE